MRGIVNSRIRKVVNAIDAHNNRLKKAFTPSVIRKIIGGVLPSELVKLNMESMDELIDDNFLKEVETVMVNSANFVLDTAEEKQFDMFRAAFLQALGGRRSFLMERYDDSFKAAFKIVERGVASGLSVANIAERLRNVIGISSRQAVQLGNQGIRLLAAGVEPGEALNIVNRRGGQMAEFRRIAIGRTELNGAFNRGMELGVSQAVDEGLVSPQIVKVWQTVGDAAVECICEPLNGEEAKLNEEFAVPEIGGTVSGPPVHVNCRCSLTFKEP